MRYVCELCVRECTVSVRVCVCGCGTTVGYVCVGV